MDLAVAAVLLQEVAAVVLPALLLQAVAVEDQQDHEVREDRFVRQEEGEEEEEDPRLDRCRCHQCIQLQHSGRTGRRRLATVDISSEARSVVAVWCRT